MSSNDIQYMYTYIFVLTFFLKMAFITYMCAKIFNIEHFFKAPNKMWNVR